MPSQFQAVVSVFNNHQIENPGARTPLMNWHSARMGGIFARIGQRTIDSAEGVEQAIGGVLGNARKATHCIEDAVSDVSESLLSAALQAGEEVAGMVCGGLDEMKEGLEGWFDSQFGGEAAQLKDWYDQNVGPRIKGLRDWLVGKKREANDMAIETMEMLSAGYNNVLDTVDALAYGAEEMSGVMRKVVCGMSAGVADLAQSGLETLGYKHMENVKVQSENLFNDTRTLKASVVMNNLQSSICAGHSPCPLPPDVPGAQAANQVMSHAQRASTDAQVAAKRFAASHSQKLGASVQAQAALITHAGVPAARGTNDGRPQAMPAVSPEKASRMAAQMNMMVADSTAATPHIPKSMQDTLVSTRLRINENPMKRCRTLPPLLRR